MMYFESLKLSYVRIHHMELEVRDADFLNIMQLRATVIQVF